MAMRRPAAIVVSSRSSGPGMWTNKALHRTAQHGIDQDLDRRDPESIRAISSEGKRRQSRAQLLRSLRTPTAATPDPQTLSAVDAARAALGNTPATSQPVTAHGDVGPSAFIYVRV